MDHRSEDNMVDEEDGTSKNPDIISSTEKLRTREATAIKATTI